MPIANDHKALLFLGAIAVLGASVRIVRAAGAHPVVGPQPALVQQIQAADSARAAKRNRAGKRSPKLASMHQAGDTVRAPKRRDAGTSGDAARPITRDHPLDIDTASAAQLDLLPGVGPAVARRIVAARAWRGTFLRSSELRGIQGVGPALLARIDTLITFSGVIRPITSSDESTFVGKGRRRKRP